MTGWLTPPPPWAAYCALMAYRIVALDKRPGVRPVGIGETLRQALAKLVMRAAGKQAKTACGNLQMCAGLEAGIERATHAIGQSRVERLQARIFKEEGVGDAVAEDPEEVGGEVAVGFNNLIIETAGSQEEVEEGLAVALYMEVDVDRGSEGEEGGVGTQRALGDLEFLTQEVEPSRTTLVDARNGFNDMSHLMMLCTVRHRWPARARYAFNCYKDWAQLLLRQPGELLVTILSREGVTQGDPLSLVLYGVTLVPLAEDLQAADPWLLSPFYADDAAFDGLARRSAQLIKMLMRRGPERGYFPEPAKSLCILDTPGQEEAAKREFDVEGLNGHL